LNSTIDIIIKDLNEAREIIDDLKSYPGVPEFQIELAKSKCKSASDVIALIKRINLTPPPPAESPEPHVQPVIKKAEPQPEKEAARPTDKKPTGFSIIADRYADRSESFSEKLGTRKPGDDVLEILRSKPLSSLDEAIGINDKFLFIREIFNGNTDSYNEAIQKLEKVGNISDAMAVIMGYAGDNSGNEAVAQLVDLIKRKFIAHE